MRLARLILAPSAIANIVFGEADPPTMLSRTSVFGERYENPTISGDQTSRGARRGECLTFAIVGYPLGG